MGVVTTINGFKTVFTQYKFVQIPKYKRLQGTGISCTRCVSHTGYFAHTRDRSRHKNNSESGVRNTQEVNVVTITGKDARPSPPNKS